VIALMSDVEDLLNLLTMGLTAADIEMSQKSWIPGHTDKAGNEQSQI
jgi:hypothetical protein